MFTGIITNIGELKKIEKGDKYSLCIKIEESFLEDLKVNDSISINGICLTVVKKETDSFFVEAMNETINLTTIKKWQEGIRLNLEKAMIFGNRLDGHMVQGHIDGVGKILEIKKDGDSTIYKLETLEELTKLIIKKGSISIDGVSLTIMNVDEESFLVGIIPHTFTNTIFQFYKVGDSVNVETDIIGKYINKLKNQITKLK